MKKLIFIDNDSPQNNRDFEDELNYVRMYLKHDFQIPREFINEMQIVDGFYHKQKEDKESMIKLLFSPDSVIVTRSMYTSSHFNSLSSFLHFLGMAGRYDVIDKVYLNTSSENYITDAVNNNIEYDKRPLDIIKAISLNHIISY